MGACRDLSTLCYIKEQVSDPDDYKGNFGYTIGGSGDRKFVTFRAVLQSFGVMNRNKRIYDAPNVMNAIMSDPTITDLLKRNQWIGEEDHPGVEFKGDELVPSRVGIPSLRLASHFVRTPSLNGNLIEATVQSNSGTAAGLNMAYMIIDGKVIPGFSARVFGELNMVSGQPHVVVTKFIAYDWVLYPSHGDALGKINQPLCESGIDERAIAGLEQRANSKIIFFDELAKRCANDSKEAEILCEAFDLTIDAVMGITTDANGLLINENGNLYVQPFVSDTNIKNKLIKEMTDWSRS